MAFTEAKTKRMLILCFVEGYWLEHGFGPSRQEIAASIGEQFVRNGLLIALQASGLIELDTFNVRPVTPTLKAFQLLSPMLPWDNFPADSIKVTQRAYEWLRHTQQG